MIKDQIPIALPEVIDLAGDSEKEKELKAFIKKFNKMSVSDAKKMKEELRGLDLIKLKDDAVVKIIDFMPQDAADIVKLIPGVSFNQDEINKILEVVKKY